MKQYNVLNRSYVRGFQMKLVRSFITFDSIEVTQVVRGKLVHSQERLSSKKRIAYALLLQDHPFFSLHIRKVEVPIGLEGSVFDANSVNYERS